MRRSGAPSQFNPAKRLKFQSPVLQQVTVPSSESNETPFISATPVDDGSAGHSDVTKKPAARAFRPVLQNLNRTAFITPGKRDADIVIVANGLKIHPTAQLPVSPSQPKSSYFSVVWGKISKKKHKKWEGDAVLLTHGRSVKLFDMEGKEIGKGTGYKQSDLETLKEDETLKVGGKEIQVMSVISEENYKTGKCFVSAAALTPAVMATRGHEPAKAFVNPLSSQQRPGNAEAAVSVSSASVTCRHDPSIPGALVMTRPTSTHQWLYNKKGLQVIDVVVDPYINIHLRPHQKEGVAFLYECIMDFRDYKGCGVILADDMGLGKTLQCITLLWTLFKQGPYGGKPVLKKALIITPGSLVKNWSCEFKKWLGSERISVFAINADQRVDEFAKTSVYPVMIISYEMFVRCYDMIQKLSFDIIICDEGHRLKNTTTKTASLIMSLPARKRIILSGTPIQNDLQEFYAIVEFVNPGVLGSSVAFRRVYEEPIVAGRQPGASRELVEIGSERGLELARLIKLFMLRRTADINTKYLPPKVELVVFCAPTRLQLALYQKLLQSQLVRSCLIGRSDGAPHLICIAALKKLTNHPSLIYGKAVEASNKAEECYQDSIYSGLLSCFPDQYCSDDCGVEESGKLQVLASLLQEIRSGDATEKVVLVSNHTKTLNMLQQFCTINSYKCVRLDGQTPTARRQEIVQNFNGKFSREFIFLLSTKAGGVGLNLIGASRLILYDIDWNPANDLQAMARVWRDGQRKNVVIYRLLTTGTIEEKIYQRQINKQGLSAAIMGSKQNTAKNAKFSLEELRNLFSLNVNTCCETHDLLGCMCAGDGTGSSRNITDPGLRPCQLGASQSVKAQRSLSMDELMDWHHVSNAAQFHKDWHLEAGARNISYVFWNETKSEEQDS